MFTCISFTSVDAKTKSRLDARFYFTEKLLEQTTHYYLDDGLPVIAFATKVTSKELAEAVEAVWSGESFFYLHLVCSDAPGAGLRGMHKMLDLARSERVPPVVFSALPEGVFYYYSKLNANFFNRLTNATVPLPPWAKALATAEATGARRVPKVKGKILMPLSDRTAEQLRQEAEVDWFRAQRRARLEAPEPASRPRRR